MFVKCILLKFTKIYIKDYIVLFTIFRARTVSPFKKVLEKKLKNYLIENSEKDMRMCLCYCSCHLILVFKIKKKKDKQWINNT